MSILTLTPMAKFYKLFLRGSLWFNKKGSPCCTEMVWNHHFRCTILQWASHEVLETIALYIHSFPFENPVYLHDRNYWLWDPQSHRFVLKSKPSYLDLGGRVPSFGSSQHQHTRLTNKQPHAKYLLQAPIWTFTCWNSDSGRYSYLRHCCCKLSWCGTISFHMRPFFYWLLSLSLLICHAFSIPELSSVEQSDCLYEKAPWRQWAHFEVGPFLNRCFGNQWVSRVICRMVGHITTKSYLKQVIIIIEVSIYFPLPPQKNRLITVTDILGVLSPHLQCCSYS